MIHIILNDVCDDTGLQAVNNVELIGEEVRQRWRYGCVLQTRNSQPPTDSLKAWKMRSGEKSDLIPCSKNLVIDSELPPDDVDGVVIEGSVMGNQLKPENIQSFTCYAAETNVINVQTVLIELILYYDKYLEKSL